MPYQTLTDIINTMTRVVAFGTPFALLLLFFMWNMAQLIMAAGDAEKMKQARERIVWGVIALFVVFSIGGLVAILQATFFGTGLGSKP